MNKLVKGLLLSFVALIMVFIVSEKTYASFDSIDQPVLGEESIVAEFDLTGPAKQEIEIEKDGIKGIAGVERIDNISTFTNLKNGYGTYKVYWYIGAVNCEYKIETYTNPSTGKTTINNAYGKKVSGVGYTFSNEKLAITRKTETSAYPARAALTFKGTFLIKGFPYTINPSLTATIKNKKLTTKYE